MLEGTLEVVPNLVRLPWGLVFWETVPLVVPPLGIFQRSRPLAEGVPFLIVGPDDVESTPLVVRDPINGSAVGVAGILRGRAVLSFHRFAAVGGWRGGERQPNMRRD